MPHYIDSNENSPAGEHKSKTNVSVEPIDHAALHLGVEKTENCNAAEGAAKNPENLEADKPIPNSQIEIKYRSLKSRI